MAHRGASAYAPENTIEAYDLAIALGATTIELDVHETLDGVLVVTHDDTIDRTLRGPLSAAKKVSSYTWAELSALDAGTWFNETHPERARPEYEGARVVRLIDVFERYGSEVSYFIELKHPPCSMGMEDEIVEHVRRLELSSFSRSKVFVGAFSQKCLHKINDLDPGIGLVQLFHSYATSSAIRAYLAALPGYCTGIGPCKTAVEERLVAAARRRGLGVFVWTVNDPHEMADMIELGVEGILTDFPDLLDEQFARSQVGRARTRSPV
ncbi:MAG: glycerophosphodiester phosphodiesterase [Actinomycetota bacterium]|nr:glycerophosphodiester phosphodiesterase [Actinomycetota bacterium]